MRWKERCALIGWRLRARAQRGNIVRLRLGLSSAGRLGDTWLMGGAGALIMILSQFLPARVYLHGRPGEGWEMQGARSVGEQVSNSIKGLIGALLPTPGAMEWAMMGLGGLIALIALASLISRALKGGFSKPQSFSHLPELERGLARAQARIDALSWGLELPGRRAAPKRDARL